MRRISAIVSFIAIAALGGCTDAARPMFIIQNQVPNDSCVPPATRNSVFLSVGAVDVNTQAGYLLFPLVQNIAQAVGNDQSKRQIFVRGADIEVTPPPNIDFPDDVNTNFSSFFSGAITPGNGTAAFTFEAVPKSFLNAVAAAAGDLTESRAILLLDVTIFGTMDGGDVESEEFRFPVEVCDGCLQNVIGQCTEIVDNDIDNEGFCDPGRLQDVVVDCCIASTGETVCPAVPESTM